MFDWILNAQLLKQAIQKADVPLIVISSVSRVRVGIVGQAIQLVDNHTFFV